MKLSESSELLLQNFPKKVVEELSATQNNAVCIPIETDAGGFRPAIFYMLKESTRDLVVSALIDAESDAGSDAGSDAKSGVPDGVSSGMSRAVSGGASGNTQKHRQFSVVLKANLHQHENGTLIELELVVETPVEPCKAAMQFLITHEPSHLDALSLLGEQAEVLIFIGDQHGATLWQQQAYTDENFQLEMLALVNEAVTLDAVIRMTDRYDADAVIAASRLRRSLS